MMRTSSFCVLGYSNIVLLSGIKKLFSGDLLRDSTLSTTERQFLMSQLYSGALALAAFPVWILISGQLSSHMIVVFGWLLGPFAAAFAFMQTRSIVTGFALSSISFCGLITTVAMLTGGIHSFAVMWLLVIPFEASLSERRLPILHALLSVLVSVAFLMQGQSFGWFVGYPSIAPFDPLGIALGPVPLIMYSAALALRIQRAYGFGQHFVNENEDRYRLLAENSTDLITRHHSCGDVMFASPASRTLLGVEPEAVSGHGYLNFVHVADRPAFLHLLSDVVARGLPLVGEFRLRTTVRRKQSADRSLGDMNNADHEFSWVEMRCRPIWDKSETVSGIVAITRDVSERKFQEEALRAAHEELKQLSEAKSQFLANMSHELRTPLNAIIGFSEILEQGLFGELRNEKQIEYVNLIRESGTHLLQVVTDILDVSKIESGTFDIVPEPLDVDSLVNTCTNIMSQQAEKRDIKLQAIVPQNLPEAVADPRACRQILINLISNALKFSNAGDRVTVGVRLDGSNLAYFVRDTGIGMSKADLSRVGQPFFQADSAHDRRYEGTGLGVSVVKGLTELHDGYVTFESELGKGTCVTVFIPLDCEANEKKVVEIIPTSTGQVPDVSDVAKLIEKHELKTG